MLYTCVHQCWQILDFLNVLPPFNYINCASGFVCLCVCLTFLDITERCGVLKLFTSVMQLSSSDSILVSKRPGKGRPLTLQMDPSSLGQIEDTHRLIFRNHKLKVYNSTYGSNLTFPSLFWDTGWLWRHTCDENWGWFIYCQTHQDCRARKKLW